MRIDQKYTVHNVYCRYTLDTVITRFASLFSRNIVFLIFLFNTFGRKNQSANQSINTTYIQNGSNNILTSFLKFGNKTRYKFLLRSLSSISRDLGLFENGKTLKKSGGTAYLLAFYISKHIDYWISLHSYMQHKLMTIPFQAYGFQKTQPRKKNSIFCEA